VYREAADAVADGFPTHLDGARMDISAINALAKMASVVREANPTWAPEVVMGQAASAFRRSFEIDGVSWKAKGLIRLGGAGPLVVNRFADKAQKRKAVVREAAVVIGKCVAEATGSEAGRTLRESCDEWLLPLCNGRAPDVEDMPVVRSLAHMATTLGTKSARLAREVVRVIDGMEDK
jgi:hypothetical protein